MKFVDLVRHQETSQRCVAAWFLLMLLVAVISGPINVQGAPLLDTAEDSYGLLTGYGQSVPGWGRTTQRVETIDLVPRYDHKLLARLGSGWYRGYHSILLEVPLHLVLAPDTSAMVGLNFLAAYTFTADARWQPYLFGGGGPVYSFADIPGMGAELNGNYQFGIGLRFRQERGPGLLLELRYHHISNGGSEEPNEPLNSWKVLFGLGW